MPKQTLTKLNNVATRTKGVPVTIGIGTLVVILVIVLIIYFVRRA